jgi:hypothetical protein
MNEKNCWVCSLAGITDNELRCVNVVIVTSEFFYLLYSYYCYGRHKSLKSTNFIISPKCFSRLWMATTMDLKLIGGPWDWFCTR